VGQEEQKRMIGIDIPIVKYGVEPPVRKSRRG